MGRVKGKITIGMVSSFVVMKIICSTATRRIMIITRDLEKSIQTEPLIVGVMVR